MFASYKEYAQLSNKDLAMLLLSDTMNYGDGKTPRSRIGERTFLSREVVHSEPGKFPPAFFANFFEAAQQTYRRMAAKFPGESGKERIREFYCRYTMSAMCSSLSAFGKSDMLYRNMIERLATMKIASEADRLMLMTLQFEVTGCLGDPGRAADLVQEALRKVNSSSLRTSISDGSHIVAPAQENVSKLGLCRVVDGNLRPRIYPLRADAAGTEIGSLATAEGAINDVEATVSRRHLRIYRDSDGAWYAVGLGSTNGTVLVSGVDGSETVVEAPRKVRQASAAQAGSSAQPVRIAPGDELVLGGTTRFMVLGLTE